MKKNDIFTFTAPNGEEVTGVVLNNSWDDVHAANVYLCYAQNRLFAATTSNQWIDRDGRKIRVESPIEIREILVDYAILPDYDELLARYDDIEVAQAETQSGM
jgi:hypothetical protein